MTSLVAAKLVRELAAKMSKWSSLICCLILLLITHYKV
jgi:uncharacterized membrane protein